MRNPEISSSNLLPATKSLHGLLFTNAYVLLLHAGANFLGGCGAGRLYCCLEPNGDIKPCVFFQTSKETVLGNMLKDRFEEIRDTNPLLWKLRIREDLEDCSVDGKKVGCGECPDKYICGGCRARAYSYFDGNVKMLDVGCIHNEPLWEKISNSRK